MTEQHMNQTIEREKTAERVETIAVLGDFNLGDADGIEGVLVHATEAEKREHDKALVDSIKKITDKTCTCCIDGRHKKGNADGSPAEVRAQLVGGSASDAGVAMNGGSPLVDTLPQDVTLGGTLDMVADHLQGTLGIVESSHLEGCGGANGETEDDLAIGSNPNIMTATRGLLAQPKILDAFQLEDEEKIVFEGANFQNVQQRAAKTAEVLTLLGWSGPEYVERVKGKSPQTVEDLEADDSKHHGHKENSIVIKVGDPETTVTKEDEFIINIAAIQERAKSLAMGSTQAYIELVIAYIAKHVATAHRLASPTIPIKIVE